METFVAILRGINVSGRKNIKMEELRTVMEDAGFGDVTTYIQSGNILFRALADDMQKLAAKVENVITEHFGEAIPVVIRSAGQLRRIFTENPFLSRPLIDEKKLHVTFLSAEPDTALAEKLSTRQYLPDEFVPAGKEIYLYCPGGYGRTKLNNTFFETKLKVTATTRNWKTVAKLLELGGEKSKVRDSNGK